MARPKENKKTRALATFADTLIVRKDGQDVHVPTTPEANKALNCLMVSQMRHIVHENLRKIQELEQPITPREMKDLIDGMAALVKTSRDTYETLDSLDDAQPKLVTEATELEEAETIDADFKTLNKPTHGDTNEPSSATAATASGASDGA